MAITEQPAPSRPRAGFRVSRWFLRIVLTLIALLAASQPVTIGQYLDGRYALLDVHATGAAALEQLGLLLIAVTIWYVVAGGRTWTLLLLGLAVAIEVQAVMGYTRILAVHVPLGVLVVGGAIGFAIWSWTAASARSRPRRTRAARASTQPAAGQPAARQEEEASAR